MLISVALRRRLYKTSRRNQSKSFVIVPSNGKNTNSVAVYNYSSVRVPIHRLPRINTVHLRFTLKYYPPHNHEPTKGKRKT